MDLSERIALQAIGVHRVIRARVSNTIYARMVIRGHATTHAIDGIRADFRITNAGARAAQLMGALYVERG